MTKKTLICILAIIFSFVIAILSTVASPVLLNPIALSSPDGTKFLRTKIGENGYGHMSPLAGYDENSDRFLILNNKLKNTTRMVHAARAHYFDSLSLKQ